MVEKWEVDLIKKVREIFLLDIFGCVKLFIKDNLVMVVVGFIEMYEVGR